MKHHSDKVQRVVGLLYRSFLGQPGDKREKIADILGYKNPSSVSPYLSMRVEHYRGMGPLNEKEKEELEKLLPEVKESIRTELRKNGVIKLRPAAVAKRPPYTRPKRWFGTKPPKGWDKSTPPKD